MSFISSAVAIIAGFAVMAILVMLGLAILFKLVPAWSSESSKTSLNYIFANLVVSAIAASAGGYVAVWLTQNFFVGMALAVFAFAMSILSAKQHGDRQPRSYQIALSIITPLFILFGGWLGDPK